MKILYHSLCVFQPGLVSNNADSPFGWKPFVIFSPSIFPRCSPSGGLCSGRTKCGNHALCPAGKAFSGQTIE